MYKLRYTILMTALLLFSKDTGINNIKNDISNIVVKEETKKSAPTKSYDSIKPQENKPDTSEYHGHYTETDFFIRRINILFEGASRVKQLESMYNRELDSLRKRN